MSEADSSAISKCCRPAVEALIVVANWAFLDIDVLGDLKEQHSTVVIARTARRFHQFGDRHEAGHILLSNISTH
jgi:hypothetical protein